MYQELYGLYRSFLQFWKLLLLSPLHCWRPCHAKSDWFPIPCYFYCMVCLILFRGNLLFGFKGILHFSYNFFTLMVFSISPCSPFLLKKINNKAQVENTLVLTKVYCFELKEFIDRNARGQSVFVFCFWYWGLGTVAQISVQWYLIHHL